MIRVIEASFVESVPDGASLSAGNFPCIAVLGRSNVGKSSFINRIAARKRLAYTSSTPGCTRAFNRYDLTLLDETGTRRDISILDLPGFGYAKFSKKDRGILRGRILGFLEGGFGLKCICILNDSRRMPEADELSLRDIAFEAGIPVLVVVTKADKLKKNEIKKQVERIAAGYGLEPHDILVSGEGLSTSSFWAAVVPII